MKNISISIAIAVLMLAACNNKQQPVQEPTKPASTAAPAKKEPVLEPSNVMMEQHKVKDFAFWKSFFDSDDSVRKQNGLMEPVVYRGIDDSNMVLVRFNIYELAKARAFAKRPALKSITKKAGVTSLPAIDFIKIIWTHQSTQNIKDRLLISHHVKNFTVWQKAFNTEGKEKRASFGCVDRGIGRGVADSNMVFIAFSITDMAKAKTRISSTEFKKVMVNAGVDSKPKVVFFREAE